LNQNAICVTLTAVCYFESGPKPTFAYYLGVAALKAQNANAILAALRVAEISTTCHALLTYLHAF
jgi:hypothetical protein